MSAWENYHLEWSADPLSVAIPTWQDITSYALAPYGPPISIPGITSSTGASDNGNRMTVSLDNSDHRFTFGNTSSPLSPNWKPGRRIRCYETITGKRIDLFSGFIQPPETDDWAEKGTDQYMQVSAVDRLGWLGNARTFITSLAEYVIYNGGTALRRFWPLADPNGSRSAQSFPAGLPLLVEGAFIGAPVDPGTVLTFGGVAGPSGDDGSYVGFTPVMNGSTVVSHNRLAIRTLSESFASGTVTFVGWYMPDATNTNYQTLLLSDYPTFNNSIQFSATSTGWQLTVGSGVNFLTLTGPTPRYGFWQLLGAQINTATGDVSMWVDSIVTIGNIGGATSGSLTSVIADTGSPNTAAACLQLYTGTFTHTQFLAQYQAGYQGLAGQTTGQRITTLALYAGIPATDVGLIDPGIATMQLPRLAGSTPLAAMRVAETTEQGRLRTNGQGLLVFDPRTRRYNS